MNENEMNENEMILPDGTRLVAVDVLDENYPCAGCYFKGCFWRDCFEDEPSCFMKKRKDKRGIIWQVAKKEKNDEKTVRKRTVFLCFRKNISVPYVKTLDQGNTWDKMKRIMKNEISKTNKNKNFTIVVLENLYDGKIRKSYAFFESGDDVPWFSHRKPKHGFLSRTRAEKLRKSLAKRTVSLAGDARSVKFEISEI